MANQNRRIQRQVKASIKKPKADALIVRNVPNVRKVVKWNSPMYGIEGQGLFLGFHTFTHHPEARDKLRRRP